MMSYVKREIARLGSDLTYQQIADGAGISVRTYEKIARGETTNPRIETLQALFNYLARRAKRADKAA